MRYKRTSIIGPEPVTLDEAKRQCFVTGNTDDSHLDRLIAAATDYAEKETWRAITPANYIAYADEFPQEIELPRPPIISVERIEYINTSGVLTELSSDLYQVDLISEPARIRAVSNWPATKPDTYNAVQVTYKAGYLEEVEGLSNRNNSPDGLRHAILMLVKHFYDNPEAVVVSGGSITVNEVPMGVDILLTHESERRFA